MEQTVTRLHRYLSIDTDDPRITYANSGFHIGGYSFHEDYAGNPLHLCFIILCIGCFSFFRNIKRDPLLLQFLAALIIAIILFNLTLRWNPWISRYHLPIFILFSPFVGIILSNLQSRYLNIIFIFILIGCSLFWVFCNRTRPLIRKKEYF